MPFHIDKAIQFIAKHIHIDLIDTITFSQFAVVYIVYFIVALHVNFEQICFDIVALVTFAAAAFVIVDVIIADVAIIVATVVSESHVRTPGEIKLMKAIVAQIFIRLMISILVQ